MPTVLKRLREGSGLTQTAMAAKLEIGVSRYNMIEHGHRPASPEIVRAICRILGVDEQALFLPSSFTLRRMNAPDPNLSPPAPAAPTPTVPPTAERKRGESA